jgi:uncharacterized protein YcfJ
MNQSTFVGVVASVGVALAGGVAGYSFLDEQRTAQSVVAQAADGKHECGDEQVSTVADPQDRDRLAATAAGEVIGGAAGGYIGDRDITTLAGVSLGALLGRKVQEEVQNKHADRRATITTERRCGQVGSR